MLPNLFPGNSIRHFCGGRAQIYVLKIYNKIRFPYTQIHCIIFKFLKCPVDDVFLSISNEIILKSFTEICNSNVQDYRIKIEDFFQIYIHPINLNRFVFSQNSTKSNLESISSF